MQEEFRKIIADLESCAARLRALHPELKDHVAQEIQTLDKRKEVLGLPAVGESLFLGIPSGDTLIELGEGRTIVAPLSTAVLADGFAQIEKRGARVLFVLMNAVDYTDIRMFGRDVLDIESQVELLKQGLQAYLWGARIVTNREYEAGKVQFLGVLEVEGKEIWYRYRVNVTR